MRLSRTAISAAIAVMIGLVAAAPSAGATEPGPVEDVIDAVVHCDPYARVPQVGSGYITGTGGTTGCLSTQPVDLTVCLELAQVPVSCVMRSGTGNIQATTPRFACVPGVYQTRTTARVNVGVTKTVHSFPPVLIVQCV